MPEFRRPKSEADFHKNFEQIKPLMSKTEANQESGRCLFCYDAPCVKACPTSIDIPLFIRQINNGNLSGSAKTIYAANYFGRICGNVCPTEVLCEGACVFEKQNIRPIDIGRLQTYATYNSIRNNKKHFELAADNGKKVAIIGAGPAGISCACELRKLGFTVDIFEAKSQPSGLTIYGVAPYKITNEDVLEEVAYLQEQFQFKIHYNSAIQSKKDLARLDSEYDAIFLGIGLGSTSGIGIKGENLDNCIGAVEFIENMKMEKHDTKIGKNVIVLGGGNTAMDAASEAARLGAETVMLCYRRSKIEMRAYWFEYDLAKSVGTRGVFNAAPLEIIGTSHVEGVKFAQTEIIDGKVKILPGSEFIKPCDMVIKATGQETQVNLLNQIDKIKLDKNGCISINLETGQTTNPKYFAGGDAINGGKEVVNAAADGKKAATGINQFLQ
ncbi:MAG: NAD(P)-dependent oxidoreductase [Calditrichaeota bacterium]|nr:MAG: NAD(P)-dependent oxidoreductase [Calditrichota bacterium]